MKIVPNWLEKSFRMPAMGSRRTPRRRGDLQRLAQFQLLQLRQVIGDDQAFLRGRGAIHAVEIAGRDASPARAPRDAQRIDGHQHHRLSPKIDAHDPHGLHLGDARNLPQPIQHAVGEVDTCAAEMVSEVVTKKSGFMVLSIQSAISA